MPKDKQQTKHKDQIRQSDVTFWGSAALISGALAILGANLPSLLPAEFITGLQSTRLDGGNLNQLRSQVAQLKTESIILRNSYAQLSSQMTLAEQGRGQVTQRVGALESSIPVILQAVPPGVGIDSSISTAAIGDRNDETYLVEGGSVSITNTSIEPSNQSEPTLQQFEMPAALDQNPIDQNVSKNEKKPETISSSEFGIAIGNKTTQTDAFIAWQEIEKKVGTLLIGLKPILSNNNDATEQNLIAGPVNSYAEAEQLCTRLVRVGIACLPVPYSGQKMPN
ncbi:MAG: hypothetical protein L3J15_03045 [Devosiaceae bacterium]|nr:hypothetical protein [Devosiaceae bacterium]